MQLLSVFQNISQINDRWGKDRAETIVANHRARLFGTGIGDRATLEYIGAILGDEATEKVSAHRDRLQLVELGSRTYAHEYRRLATPNKVREAQPATALLVYGRLKPTWIRLRPWYEDRELIRKVNTIPADTAGLGQVGRSGVTGIAQCPGAVMTSATAAPRLVVRDQSIGERGTSRWPTRRA